MPGYYLHRNGQSYGPYPPAQMMQMLATGQVRGDELICEEGGSQWVPASTLGQPQVGGGGRPVAQAPGYGYGVMAVTQQQVASAYQKLKVPALGIVFSAALPVILWAAKSDAERGVATSGKYGALKNLAKENTELLPVAVVVGIVGVIACSVWLTKSLKKARMLKAQLARQHFG